MWYFVWACGLAMVLGFGVLNAMWVEKRLGEGK